MIKITKYFLFDVDKGKVYPSAYESPRQIEELFFRHGMVDNMAIIEKEIEITENDIFALYRGDFSLNPYSGYELLQKARNALKNASEQLDLL